MDAKPRATARVATALRFRPGLHRWLRSYAKRQGLSINAVVEQLVEELREREEAQSAHQ